MAKRGQLGHVAWDTAGLLKEIEKLQIEQIDKVALEVLAESREPVDTGFLAASAYVNSSSGLNTFGEVWQPGRYLSRRTGRMADRALADAPEPPPEGGAVAGWAATYAVYVNESTEFIYEALQRVGARYTR
jgi:hypothetical protein